jgi:hypothetical protein
MAIMLLGWGWEHRIVCRFIVFACTTAAFASMPFENLNKVDWYQWGLTTTGANPVGVGYAKRDKVEAIIHVFIK